MFLHYLILLVADLGLEEDGVYNKNIQSSTSIFWETTMSQAPWLSPSWWWWMWGAQLISLQSITKHSHLRWFCPWPCATAHSCPCNTSDCFLLLLLWTLTHFLIAVQDTKGKEYLTSRERYAYIISKNSWNHIFPSHLCVGGI